MCGIAGILGQVDDANRSALRRMNDAMVHRGPDGEGYWESIVDDRGWGVMLAHRRLAILDLSSAGAQPMVDPIAGDVLVTNGEIYNYVELRRSLSDKVGCLRSTGDTAVMLRALSEDGLDGVDRLRGMFAFAFWNVSKRTLLIARDPLGIKPLYIARNPDPRGTWKLLFASEVRAILASQLLGTPKLNPRAIASVVWNGFVVAPETAISQIEAVLPGELRVYDSRGRQQVCRQYWRMLSDKTAQPSDENELSSVLAECVRLHLASDAPLGVFLSGGIDSSAIANLAQKAANGTVSTFTLAFEEQAFSEGLIAREVAKSIGTDHHELLLTEGHFANHLESALESLDQPTFDGLNSYYMSRAVRDAGLKVALVGTGGDELFGGYKSFRQLPALQSLGHIPRNVRAVASKAISLIVRRPNGQVPPQTRWAKFPEMLNRRPDLLTLYQIAYALFLPDFQRQLLGNETAEVLIDGLPPVMRARIADELRNRPVISAISVLEQRLFLGERLLPDTDAASMSASIEVRLPLVDRVLVECVDRLPVARRFKPVGRKAMLQRIGLRGLNLDLFDRPKSGFVLPYEQWLKSGLRKRVDATMRDTSAVTRTGLNAKSVEQLWAAFVDGAPGLYWSRVWAVYVLIRWCQRHGAVL